MSSGYNFYASVNMGSQIRSLGGKPDMDTNVASYLFLARLTQALHPLFKPATGNGGRFSAGPDAIRFYMVGAAVEVYIRRDLNRDRYPHLKGQPVTSDIMASVPWVLHVEAKRGGGKPILYLQDTGTFSEKQYGGYLLTKPHESLSAINLDEKPLELAEIIYEAGIGCLEVYRRYTPGLHLACKSCSNQLACAANTKNPRPIKEKKK